MPPLDLPPPRFYAPYLHEHDPLQMRLHPLDLRGWIELDALALDELAQKQRLLATRRDEVFAALPVATSGARETLALLVDHLTAHFPQFYQRDGSLLHNHIMGETWSLDDSSLGALNPLVLHPLDLAGRLVQEDLCLMRRDEITHRYHLVAASLCFPARWRLAEKLGAPLAAVHANVPGYDSRLATPMDRLFDRLRSERPVWRINWNVVNDPALFQPNSPVDNGRDITPDDAGKRLWLRMERQTLRRLPQSHNILFAIRTYVEPLANLAGNAETRGGLAAALRALTPAMRGDKGVTPFLEAALAWLAGSKPSVP